MHINKNKQPRPTLQDEVARVADWYLQNKPSVKRIQVNATQDALLKLCHWQGDELYFNGFHIENIHVPKLTRKQYERLQGKL